ncbi:uncharacterized protein LOC126887446 [Diabrotica virgifera virgifera]|uniref:Protein ANTAGONIST OF LIKE HETEROCHROMATIN PROTEIN 1-like n=1 Tax=Diabrotica virgifera virgifera TaxID=50390 RepID=A0A6P7GTE8_DIAVI|nr:uncharacterized protein LOC126887446 [Diabrotica virgifera virgifera]
MSTEVKKTLLLLNVAVVATMMKNKKKRKPRKYWVKPWLNAELGNLRLPQEFLDARDLQSFKNFLRMNEYTFLKLLEKINPRIQKKDTNFRQCIPSRTKLIITLRYLSTGETFRSLMYNYRVSESAISEFIPIVCRAIYDELKRDYLKVPCTTEEWLNISKEFEETWNLPNILGAIDGKHVIIQAQQQEGSAFYNYKKQHSIVLLGLVDANYNFLYVNVGMNGRVSDGGVYRESDLYKAVEQNVLKFPNDKPLPLRNTPVPFVFVADAAFPLSTHIMKPYPFRNMTRQERIFNYRLSRVRRVVENTFGILANRFRVLLNVNLLVPEKVKIVTLACCALHNFLRHELKTKYTGVNPERDINKKYTLACGLSAQGGNRPKKLAIEIREEFKEYVNGVGSVSWQEDMC